MSIIDIPMHHPIMDIRDNLVFVNNGTIVLCYTIELPVTGSLSEKDLDAAHLGWLRALKELPVGTVIHKQDIYLREYYAPRANEGNSFLSKATDAYFKGREFMGHRCQLFFSLPKNGQLTRQGHVNPFRKVEKGIYREMDRQATEFTVQAREAVSFLRGIKGISLFPMEEKQIMSLTEDYFNGYQKGMTTEMTLASEGCTIGDAHYGVLAINSESCFGQHIATAKPDKRFSSEGNPFQQGPIDDLGLYLDGDHIVNQIIFMDDTHRWRKALDKKITELKKSSNFGTWNKLLLGRVEKLQGQIDKDPTASIVRGQLNIIYWSPDREALADMGTKIKTIFRELDMIPHGPSPEGTKHYILNSFPLFSTNFSNRDLYVADLKHALCLTLGSTAQRSDSEGILFNERIHNIPVLRDVWDSKKKRIKARNFAIFAPTGEGKSFLANNILRQFFEQGTRLVIIDLGGSYAKLAKLYHKDAIVLRYKEGRALGINPFYLRKAIHPDANHLEELTVFLFELMGGGKEMEKGRSVSLKKILGAYYNGISEGHSLKGFHHFVKGGGEDLLASLEMDSSHFDIPTFLHILSEYIDGGLYGFLFGEDGDDGAAMIGDKRLIIFELDEVKGNRELLSVMLKLIKVAVKRTIWSNRGERGIVLFDEFAEQLKFDNVLSSVEFYYQAIRKQEGAVGIVLQSINQLPQNGTSASILENTQVIYSLRNEKGYEDLVGRLNFSSHDHSQLRSMRNDLLGARKYTELFMKIGTEGNVLRLEVPPEAFAAYLTDGPENEKIMEFFEECGNMEQAITAYLEQMGGQVSRNKKITKRGDAPH